VQVLEKLQPPLIVKADLITGESVRFAWNAVPGAKGYQVSRNHINFTAPSPDPNGLTHTVNGLKGGDTLSLVVKATADLECQAIISDTAFARTLTYVYFVPNMFSPNGDGKNDEFRVYGNTIQSLKLMVFNQWGQKVFEASDKNNGWNGTFNGGPAPVGVYMYVSQINFTNGTTQTAKGSFTLIR
jgi:gliding motility-associated-like protein